MDVKGIAQGVGKWFSKNLPTLVTGVGLLGFVTTVVLVAKASPEVKKELDEAKETKKEELTVVEKIKIAAPKYAPSMAVGAASIACFIFADRANLKRNAAAIAAYQISETALRNLQTAAIKTVGTKEAENMKHKADVEGLKNHPADSTQVIITGYGEQLCFDSISGRYFKSTIEKIRQAQNTINDRLFDENTLGLNEFYYELGLPLIDVGDKLGWNKLDLGDKLEIRFTSHITTEEDKCPYGEGSVVLVINYDVKPTYF